jgi:hypothetical protein
MASVNVRLGYRPRQGQDHPWGLLAWYLGQIDEVADAPGFTTAVPQPRRGLPVAATSRWPGSSGLA